MQINTSNRDISITSETIGIPSGGLLSTKLNESRKMYKDRFGFWVDDNFHQAQLISEDEANKRKEKETERTKKWVAMIKTWNIFHKNRPNKIKSRVRKGIPDAVRTSAWRLLTNLEDVRKKYPNLNTINISSLSEIVRDEIERDIDRTFPKHDLFMTPRSSGQLALRRVLHWYAVLDPDVGYCQGMGFIVGMLLTYMIEEDAFYCFYDTMTNARYNLRELYLPSMTGPKRILYVYDELLKRHMKRLYVHLQREGIHPSMYVTGWILTLYSRDFNFDLCTRVWEIFLNEGFKIVYRVALALLKNIEKELLTLSFEDIMGAVRIIPSTVDAPRLIQLACTIPVRRKEVDALNKKANNIEGKDEDVTSSLKDKLSDNSYKKLISAMPICAEKLLLQLQIYAIGSGSDIIHKDNVVAKVDEIERLLKIENLMSEKVETLIKRMKSTLQSRVSSLNIKDCLLSDITHCLTELGPIDSIFLVSLVEKTTKEARKIRGKDVVLLIGKTGSGKSTTIQFLGGSKLELDEQTSTGNDFYKVVNGQYGVKDLETFTMNSSGASETININAVDIKLRSGGNITLCDSPGFGDNRGVEIDLSNSLGVASAVRQCKSVRLLAIISNSDVSDRLDGVVSLFDTVSSFMNRSDENLESLSYWFTKVPFKDKMKISKRIDTKRGLISDKSIQSIFSDMSKKLNARTDGAIIIDPLSSDRHVLLDDLLKVKAISNPSSVFVNFASSENLQKIKLQQALHERSIRFAIERGDFDLVEYKLHHLKEMMTLYSMNETLRGYSECVLTIKSHVEKTKKAIHVNFDHLRENEFTSMKTTMDKVSLDMLGLIKFDRMREEHFPEVASSYVDSCFDTLKNMASVWSDDGDTKWNEFYKNSDETTPSYVFSMLRRLYIVNEIFNIEYFNKAHQEKRSALDKSYNQVITESFTKLNKLSSTMTLKLSQEVESFLATAEVSQSIKKLYNMKIIFAEECAHQEKLHVYLPNYTIPPKNDCFNKAQMKFLEIVKSRYDVAIQILNNMSATNQNNIESVKSATKILFHIKADIDIINNIMMNNSNEITTHNEKIESAFNSFLKQCSERLDKILADKPPTVFQLILDILAPLAKIVDDPHVIGALKSQYQNIITQVNIFVNTVCSNMSVLITSMKSGAWEVDAKKFLLTLQMLKDASSLKAINESLFSDTYGDVLKEVMDILLNQEKDLYEHILSYENLSTLKPLLCPMEFMKRILKYMNYSGGQSKTVHVGNGSTLRTLLSKSRRSPNDPSSTIKSNPTLLPLKDEACFICNETMKKGKSDYRKGLKKACDICNRGAHDNCLVQELHDGKTKRLCQSCKAEPLSLSSGRLTEGSLGRQSSIFEIQPGTNIMLSNTDLSLVAEVINRIFSIFTNKLDEQMVLIRTFLTTSFNESVNLNKLWNIIDFLTQVKKLKLQFDTSVSLLHEISTNTKQFYGRIVKELEDNFSIIVDIHSSKEVIVEAATSIYSRLQFLKEVLQRFQSSEYSYPQHKEFFYERPEVIFKKYTETDLPLLIKKMINVDKSCHYSSISNYAQVSESLMIVDNLLQTEMDVRFSSCHAKLKQILQDLSEGIKTDIENESYEKIGKFLSEHKNTSWEDVMITQLDKKLSQLQTKLGLYQEFRDGDAEFQLLLESIKSLRTAQSTVILHFKEKARVKLNNGILEVDDTLYKILANTLDSAVPHIKAIEFDLLEKKVSYVCQIAAAFFYHNNDQKLLKRKDDIIRVAKDRRSDVHRFLSKQITEFHTLYNHILEDCRKVFTVSTDFDDADDDNYVPPLLTRVPSNQKSSPTYSPVVTTSQPIQKAAVQKTSPKVSGGGVLSGLTTGFNGFMSYLKVPSIPKESKFLKSQPTTTNTTTTHTAATNNYSYNATQNPVYSPPRKKSIVDRSGEDEKYVKSLERSLEEMERFLNDLSTKKIVTSLQNAARLGEDEFYKKEIDNIGRCIDNEMIKLYNTSKDRKIVSVRAQMMIATSLRKVILLLSDTTQNRLRTELDSFTNSQLQEQEELTREIQLKHGIDHFNQWYAELLERIKIQDYQTCLTLKTSLSSIIDTTIKQLRHDLSSNKLSVVLSTLANYCRPWHKFIGTCKWLSRNMGYDGYNRNKFDASDISTLLYQFIENDVIKALEVVFNQLGFQKLKSTPKVFGYITNYIDFLDTLTSMNLNNNSRYESKAISWFFLYLAEAARAKNINVISNTSESVSNLVKLFKYYCDAIHQDILQENWSTLDIKVFNDNLLVYQESDTTHVKFGTFLVKYKDNYQKAYKENTSCTSYEVFKRLITEKLTKTFGIIKSSHKINTANSAETDEHYAALASRYYTLHICIDLQIHFRGDTLDIDDMAKTSTEIIKTLLDDIRHEAKDNMNKIFSNVPKPPIDIDLQNFKANLDNLRSANQEFEKIPNKKGVVVSSYAEKLLDGLVSETKEHLASVVESTERIRGKAQEILKYLEFLKVFSIHISIAGLPSVVNQKIDDILNKENSNVTVEVLQTISDNSENEIYQMLKHHKKFEHTIKEYWYDTVERFTIEQVLDPQDGLKSNEASHTLSKSRIVIKEKYEIFQEQYTQIVTDNMHNPTYLSTLVRETQVLPNDRSSLPQDEMIMKLMVNIFAYWTLSKHFESSAPKNEKVHTSNHLDGDISHTDGVPDIAPSSNRRLMKPHAGQIVAIFRIFNLDHGVGFQNHIVEILTGEGKSLILAVTASILVLLGYSVDCVCYSEYLSKRDRDDFHYLFVAFNISQYIEYGTFNELCEKFIEDHAGGSIRDQVLTNLGLSVAESPRRVIRASNRKRILLIDEVDVFFGEDFYGNIYKPVAKLKHENITALIKHIWTLSKTSDFSLREIKASQYYQKCINTFAGATEMMEEAVLYMYHQRKEMMSEDPKSVPSAQIPVIKHDKVGYKDQDQISYSINYGFRTMWTYFEENDKMQISKTSLESMIYIPIDCGQFSIAEVPKMYQNILGVSGTVDIIEKDQVLKNVYSIKKISKIPSVYGTNKLQFRPDGGDVIIEPDNAHYRAITDQINERRGKYSRPVLVFFETAAHLNEYYKSGNNKKSTNQNVITESTTAEDKESFIRQAMSAGKITLLTKDFGRGTDFIIFDEKVKSANGAHVIQTFLSEDESEEIQIKGRTARQGNKGSYSMILSSRHLEKFNVTDQDIKSVKRKGNYDELLKRKREEFFRKQRDGMKTRVQSYDDEHKMSLEFIDDLKTRRRDKIFKFLKTANMCPDKYMKESDGSILILMDATGSMSSLLDNAKNAVYEMFKRVKQILEDDGGSTAFEVQFAVYRNYNVDANYIVEWSDWTSDAKVLYNFLSNIIPRGGLGNEAIELGLAHANRQLADKRKIDRIILIGDMPPNSVSQVTSNRMANYGENYWRNTMGPSTHYSTELNKLKQYAPNLKIYSFYLNGYDAKNAFTEIATSTGGICDSLDVSNKEDASVLLTDKVTSEILGGIGDENRGRRLKEAYKRKYQGYVK